MASERIAALLTHNEEGSPVRLPSHRSEGDYQKTMYQNAPDFRSHSRRTGRRIASDVTAGATQNMDEKTSRLVFHLTVIA